MLLISRLLKIKDWSWKGKKKYNRAFTNYAIDYIAIAITMVMLLQTVSNVLVLLNFGML